MKNIGIYIGMFCLLGACHANSLKIKGDIGELKEDKIYLGEIVNEYYGTYKPLDSAVIENGRFSFDLDNVAPELLFLGFRQGEGGMVFVQPGTLKVRLGKSIEGEISWEVEGAFLDHEYREFLDRRDRVRNQNTIDSLDALFFAARDRQDRQEMSRIKELSIPFYEDARLAEEQLIREMITQNRDNAFGIYLYYSKLFARKQFPDQGSIETERKYVAGFGSQAMSTVYKKKMDRQLDLCAGCAIGAVAPEITGTDTLGNPLKLSDLRGQYVIVDFWNSYCHWCREETPWLRKAMETFRDRNFTILGVSDDRSRDLWMHAIREDKSCWDHLLLRNGDAVMTTYCIKGIPHIILVGPDGKILAKELRHEELTEVPAKYLP